MKIGLIIPNIPGYSETFFRSKIKGLQEKGHEVLLFTGSRPHTYSPDLNCAVYCSTDLSGSAVKRVLHSSMALLKLLLTAPASAFKLFQLHRQLGDKKAQSLRSLVINSHILPHKLDWLHFGFATMGVGRELVGKAIGAKVAVSFRGYDISIYPLKYDKVYNRLWLNLDKVHTISDDLLHRAFELGLPPNISVEKITPAIQAGDFLHPNRIEPISHPVKILTVGRMHWKKGGELMLDALAMLNKEGIPFEFTWVGDGPERERLCFAAHQHKLEGAVHFLGKVPHQRIPELMHDHDIYLQYSIQEGFCNAVLEAQAAGMLTVVSDAEGLSENVIHGETGWVVPKLEHAALADTLVKVIGLAEKQQAQIREQAVKRVQQHFRMEQQQQAFQAFYEA